MLAELVHGSLKELHLIGAQFALGWSSDEMLRRNRKFWEWRG